MSKYGVKVVLRYQRLRRPRGGWRWPLEFWLGYQPERSGEQLACDLEVQLVHPWPYPREAISRLPKRGDNVPVEVDWIYSPDGGELAGLGWRFALDRPLAGHWYFLTCDRREDFIGVLHSWFAALRRALADWLASNPTSPGDGWPVVLEAAPGREEVSPCRRRRIIGPAGGGERGPHP